MRSATWLVMLALALGAGPARADWMEILGPGLAGAKKTEKAEEAKPKRTHMRSRSHRSRDQEKKEEQPAAKSEETAKVAPAPPLPRPAPNRTIPATPPVTKPEEPEKTTSAPPLPKPAPAAKIALPLPVKRPEDATKAVLPPPLPRPAPAPKVSPAPAASKPEEPTKTAAAPPLPRPAPALKITAPPSALKSAPPATIATLPAEPKPAAPAKIVALPPAPKPVAKPQLKFVPEDDDVFAGIPPGERRQIQAALLWSGDYSDSAKGEDRMRAAVKSYQKRSKDNVSGVLTPEERTNLIAAAERHEREYGWSIVTDPATGIRIGLPTKLVPLARAAGSGTLWSSKHGDVQVETFRAKGAQAKLSDLYERERKKNNRSIDFSNLRADGFHISGLQGLKIFSVRATERNGEVRGFTMLYDQMMETIVEPVANAMVHAFTPFPERSAPMAALAKSVDYGSGLIVSTQGHIVTDRKITDGCQVIVAVGIGNAERVADDEDNGLALLRVYGARKLDPLVLAPDGPDARELTLVGVPDPQEQSGGTKVSEVKARLAARNAVELRRPVPMAGFSGAAALDRQNRVVGMLETRSVVLASIKPSLPPVRLISSDTIRDFLAKHGVMTAPTQTGDAKASVVRIICVRK